MTADGHPGELRPPLDRVDDVRDERLRSLLRHLHGMAVAVFDRDLRCTLVAGESSGSGPWSRERLQGRTLRELCGARAERLESLLRGALTGQVRDIADYFSPTDERRYWIQIAPVPDRHGVVTAAMLVAQDVTSAREAADELAALRNRFEVAFTNAPIGMAVVAPDGRLLEFNDHLAALLGSPRPVIAGSSVFDFVHPEDRAAARSVWTEVLAEAGRHVTEERRYLRADGSVVWVRASHVLATDSSDAPQYVVMQCQDVTAQRTAEEDLRQLALHDPLTGLGNRTLLLDRLTHAMERADRRRSQVAVLFLDLDRFKVVNDSLGHDVGDEVLTVVAHRLRAALRPEDTVARLGGDEFAVLCEDVRDEEDARQIAARIAAAASGPVSVLRGTTLAAADATDEPVPVEVSVGVAVAGPDHSRPADLLRDADLAMYAAKSRGRGRVELLTDSMRVTATRRLRLETALRVAIRRGDLELVYQPIVSLARGTLVGFETLARWTDDEQGAVPPSEFIPMAEESGLIGPLGAWVLRTACQQAQVWRTQYPEHADFTLAVNLSARQLIHPDHLGTVRATLAQTGTAPHQLTLEITESTLMEAAGSAMAAVRSLKRQLGVGIAIDDFGTGYSSLAYLTRLPVDALKIDRAFVDGLAGVGADANDAAVVDAVLSLARTLDLRVTAEGVETAEQVDHLRSLGCEFAQGYHFARPLVADAVPEWLATV